MLVRPSTCSGTIRRRRLRVAVALLAGATLSVVMATVSAQQPPQSSAQSGVGITPSRPQGNSNILPPPPVPATADEIVAAAARAAGTPLPGPPGALPSAAAVRSNPFSHAAAPEANGPGVVIPANPTDASKVVVQENDGLVSLMVREGSLRQVVSMIAETQKLNIVFAGPTDTMVTASFDRQPWNVVLDALLTGSGHVSTVRDNVIFVSSLDSTSFLPPGTDGREVAVFNLDFASAVDIDQTVKGLLSAAGESWLVETNKSDNRRTKEAIAVVDFPSNLARISEYVCQADQPPRQVYIEAHVLQVELKDDCKSGVDFDNLISLSNANINLNSVGFANGDASPAFFVDVDGVGLDGVIELLKSTTDAKTLASPKIHAVSGQESHIQIGGQLGYPITTTTQTSTMESVQFLDVGVVLRVTPRITRDGRVLMRIFPKVSTGRVDPVTSLPSEETTEVETDVLVSSGQGIVIGGLIQEVDDVKINQLPLLGDIPYLGILFQKRTVTKSRKEIIVSLRPHVLPYSPIVQATLEHDFKRSVEPLTQGALCSYPRPYEPAMYDALNPKEHKQSTGDWDYGPISTDLVPLPPVEEIGNSTEAVPVEMHDDGGGTLLEALPEPSPTDALDPALESN